MNKLLIISFSLLIIFSKECIAEIQGSIFCNYQDGFYSAQGKDKLLNEYGELDHGIEFFNDVTKYMPKELTPVVMDFLKSDSQFLLRYSHLMTILDTEYSPIQFKLMKYIPSIEGFHEYENIYVSNKTEKLVANNQYCELIIKEETGKYFCDMNLNLETNVNEKIFVKLMCEWN